MDSSSWRRLSGTLGVTLVLVVRIAEANAPVAGFSSLDQRLPNPDRPYEMTNGTVNFNAPPFFGLYDLEFEPTDPSQLRIPTPTPSGTLFFDSEFDISYTAMVSFGLEPVHPVTGIGKAHVVGTAPAGSHFEPQVFETELRALNLYGLSPIPEVYFRESPTLASKGITIREDLCPLCLGPLTHWRIASFFDVYAEFSYNGGNTWTPGNKSFRIEQEPGPGLAGDYNGDGSVDGADYIVLRAGLGSTYRQLDVLLWRANFGNTAGLGGVTTFAAVPEPSSMLLLIAAIARVTIRRKPRDRA
jgi:hypothetical protein